MPSRKSNVSVTSNGAEDGKETTPAKGAKDGVSVEDLSLPKSMIARLAKGVLPANTQIHKDALLALHKSATVFVSYIASNSNENAQSSGKKTILPLDVTAALKDAEFEEFLPRLEAELKKYNEVQCDKRNSYRRKIKVEKAAAAAQEGPDPANTNQADAVETNNGVMENITAEQDDEDRPAKKFKGENGFAVAQAADGFDDDEFDGEQDPDEHDEDGDVEDDGAADEIEEVDEDQAPDETMEDAIEQTEEHGVLRDEALDEPDSD